MLPLSGENWVDVIQVAGDTRPFTQMPTANFRFIGPDYFRTMGMTLKRGRSFTANERSGATLPAIVTERTAAVAWPGLDPIGRRFLRGDPKQTPFEVVGIIADGYNTRIDAASPLMVYVPVLVPQPDDGVAGPAWRDRLRHGCGRNPPRRESVRRRDRDRAGTPVQQLVTPPWPRTGTRQPSSSCLAGWDS